MKGISDGRGIIPCNYAGFRSKTISRRQGECDAGVFLWYGEEHSTKPLSLWERGRGEGSALT
jgi:hypothetical protein